jgi:hypothetical protein
MATEREIRGMQKRVLHHFLRVKKELEENGVASKHLNEIVSVFETEMDIEDVAYVQKRVKELED